MFNRVDNGAECANECAHTESELPPVCAEFGRVGEYALWELYRPGQVCLRYSGLVCSNLNVFGSCVVSNHIFAESIL